MGTASSVENVENGFILRQSLILQKRQMFGFTNEQKRLPVKMILYR